MAINPQNFDKSEQMKWSSDDQGSSQVRSYTCTFCYRGFSNAQALGGHMNIHRKERAELKQAADENAPPLDIAINPTDHEPQSLEEKFLFQLDSSEENSCTPERPDDTRGKVGVEELQQLSLFVETPSAGDDKMAIDCDGCNEKKEMQLSHALPQTAEVDLELRLGPEPQGTSTAISTREFF